MDNGFNQFDNNNQNGNQFYYNNSYNYPPQGQPPRQPAPKKGRFGIGLLVGILGTFGVVLIAVVIGLFFFFRTRGFGGGEMGYQEKLNLIQTYLDAYYLGELDPEKVEESLAAGLLNGTGDKYAQYYNKKEFQNLMEETSGVYGGIGVGIITNDDEQIEVYKIYENSPAEEAGIRIGDIIIEADGERDFADMDALVALVRGEQGTFVDIVILRDGEEILMRVERRAINIETVEYEMLDNNIGYIALSEFDTVSVNQFNEAYAALESEGMTSLIMDLRGNPGGDYDTVIALADRVLPEGKITTVVNNQGKEKVERSDDEHQIRIPMVLLVNKTSASASELFSAAVKDYGIATIIGETTYGKGIVQSIYQLPDGSGMKFTTEEYLSPNGNKINGLGVTPDIAVEIPKEAYDDGVLSEEEDTQLQKAIEVLMGGAEARNGSAD